VCFPYPYYDADQITIHLPEGMQLEDLPQESTVKNDFAAFVLQVRSEQKKDNPVLIFHRELAMEGFLFLPKDYPDLRAFFEHVRDGDEVQVVLKVWGNSQTRK